MAKARTGLANQVATVGRNRGAITLMAFVGIIAAVLTFGTLIPPPPAAHAASSEPWIYMDCLKDGVVEGEDFRLVVRKRYTDPDPAPYKKIRVFWYTDEGTADETDYERLWAEGQASNSYQSRTGKMGRDFHTREDFYPEIDETFTVRFNNSNDDGHDGSCEITIKDDDGVGIYELEIRSLPRILQLGEGQSETVTAYTHGDRILVTAKFNHPVTTRNPETGEQTDYAGLYLGIGENRRIARVLRGDGTDELIFGYTVQLDDVDEDGISVENGWIGTGLVYNKETEDFGLWPVNSDDGRFNGLFFGLEDDPGHPVVQPDVNVTIVDPPAPTPPDEDNSGEDPPPPVWAEGAINIEPNLLDKIDGELTAEDEGRDWYAFEAVAGEDYFIELVSTMDLAGPSQGEPYSIEYVEDKLVDPSILEILNEEGEQVMEEVYGGGFLYMWARAHFVPPEDGTYYIAIGAGPQARGYLGFYTLSVRADDYADDHQTVRDVVLRPGGSVTGCIDSDVAPDDPGLNPWDWWESSTGHAVPLRGLESLDDRDFIRFEIEEAGTYELALSGAPRSVGIWATWSGDGYHRYHAEPDPVLNVEEYYEPGTYFVEVGTPWKSEGNTGLYDVYLFPVHEESSSDVRP